MNFWDLDKFWLKPQAKPTLKVVSGNGSLRDIKPKKTVRPVPMCLIPKEPA